ASVKYSDWERRPGVEASAGLGNTGVIIGRPRQTERFPGDPTSNRRLPAPPRAPEDQERSGVERPPPATPDEIISSTALPEGEIAGLVGGYLYFPYKLKMSTVKAVELLYHAAGCDVSLKL